ncbi:MAG: two-component system sensor histidine kinase NtrB [Thermoleophilia bacterium]
MNRIFVLMALSGTAIGLVFPYAADPFVTWNPDGKIYFRAICLAAGLIVGTLCFYLVKITIYPKNLLLAQQKAEWQASFNSLAEGIALVDAEVTVRRVNSTFARMVGISASELLGQDLATVMASRCGKQSGNCLITKALHTREEQTAESAMGDRICTQSASPILDAEGKADGCVFVLRDVTASRRLQKEMLQSARMAAVNHLVSGAAHEINNPLMGVTGMAELLLARDDIDDKVRSDAQVILREGQRASEIVRQLLNYVSTGVGETRVFDLNEPLHEIVSLRGADLKAAAIEVRESLNPGALEVEANPDQMKQVFLNLIDNAEKALTANDGGRLLQVRTEAVDHVARLHIVDNGPGIPAGADDHIFDAFFTTREVGQGTGLGLTMSYSIITESGGRLWHEPGDGNGAHFIIELPLAQESG